MHPQKTSPDAVPKILIISSLGPPPYLGGIENVIDTLLKSKLAKKYTFSIFDTYRKPDQQRTTFSKVLFALLLPFRCGYSCMRFKPDMAHIHFCSRVDFWKHSLCLLACKVSRTKTIFHLHGGSFDNIYHSYNYPKQVLVRLILRQPDFLIALSGYWKNFLSDLTGKENIHIIPNPINCALLAKYSTRSPQNDIDHSVVLLGSLGKRKGHYDVLKAAKIVVKQYPDSKFYFAGLDEDCGATEQLKRLAHEQHLNDNIQFLGPVSGETKLKLLGKTGIVILPSYGENMPISVLEGMAAWKPVITTRVGAIPEVITHKKNGLLIDPGDWQKLGQQIIWLFDNPEKAAQIGKRAGEKVREQWDVDKIALLVDKFFCDYHQSEVIPQIRTGC